MVIASGYETIRNITSAHVRPVLVMPQVARAREITLMFPGCSLYFKSTDKGQVKTRRKAHIGYHSD